MMMATSTRRGDAHERLHQHKLQHQHQRHVYHPQQTDNLNAKSNTSAAATATTNATVNASLNSVAAKHAQAMAISSPRMKRPLDPIANHCDPSKTKRTKIAVEILSRPIPIAPIPPTNSTNNSSKPITITAKSQSQSQSQQPLTNEPTVASTPPTHPPLPARQQTSKTATVTTATDPPLKKYKEKANKGIKHELDRLQPNAADTSSATERPGRKLRSQEATRFKSELSAYFPDYDEVIGNDPKEQHVLNIDTPIVLVDTNSRSLFLSDIQSQAATILDSGLDQRPHTETVRKYSDNLFTGLHDSQRVDFTFLETSHNSNNLDDPLPDAYYEPAHKKAERLEKSIRNTEKGRAQHEKDQIIRLLNELQGHDWLRTMGVSGVTESRKKKFEPARDHFIKGCQAILDKFRIWTQEEKRRKLVRERALAEEREETEEKETNADDEEEEQEEEQEEEDLDEDENEDDEMADVGAEDDNMSEAASDGDPPDYSDVDASARQLHDEAMARARYASSSSKRSRGEPPPKSPEPYMAKEFTSFFSKRHQRDAALNKSRRRGRTVVAWGHAVPDMMECDFDLPEEYRDMQTLKAHERQKRRERRQRQP